MNTHTVLEIVGALSDTFGFIGGIFAVVIFFRLRALTRINDQIKIFLVVDGGNSLRVRELPLRLRRGDVTRAEVLGRIGMMPMREPGKRFSIRYLATPAFLDDLNAVADGKSSELEIRCSDEELGQFIF